MNVNFENKKVNVIEFSNCVEVSNQFLIVKKYDFNLGELNKLFSSFEEINISYPKDSPNVLINEFWNLFYNYILFVENNQQNIDDQKIIKKLYEIYENKNLKKLKNFSSQKKSFLKIFKKSTIFILLFGAGILNSNAQNSINNINNNDNSSYKSDTVGITKLYNRFLEQDKNLNGSGEFIVTQRGPNNNSFNQEKQNDNYNNYNVNNLNNSNNKTSNKISNLNELKNSNNGNFNNFDKYNNSNSLNGNQNLTNEIDDIELIKETEKLKGIKDSNMTQSEFEYYREKMWREGTQNKFVKDGVDQPDVNKVVYSNQK